MNLARQACEQDDPALADKAISTVSDADELWQLQDSICKHAIECNATNVLIRIIELHSLDVKRLDPMTVAGHGKTSEETLEVLISHGWDVNWRAREGSDDRSYPYIWHVVKDVNKVAWCLAHGATLAPKDMEPYCHNIIPRSQWRFSQLLERTAAVGSVDSFKLLHSQGAPIGWRSLQLAVERACVWGPDESDPTSERGRQYAEAMNMVRHLVEVVGLDVNAEDAPPKTYIPMRFGPPINYIACIGETGSDIRGVTWYLLDRGADPTEALSMAKTTEYDKFVCAVEEWRTLRGTQAQLITSVSKYLPRRTSRVLLNLLRTPTASRSTV